MTGSARTEGRGTGIRAVLCLLMVFGLLACGHRQVRNQPPFVQVSGWQLNGEQLVANLHVRNVNDEALLIQALELELHIDLVELARYRAEVGRSVAANGLESVSLPMSASDDGARLLRELEAGAMSSLPYVLEGRIRTVGDQTLPISHQGRIYRVPGRPGQFR